MFDCSATYATTIIITVSLIVLLILSDRMCRQCVFICVLDSPITPIETIIIHCSLQASPGGGAAPRQAHLPVGGGGREERRRGGLLLLLLLLLPFSKMLGKANLVFRGVTVVSKTWLPAAG